MSLSCVSPYVMYNNIIFIANSNFQKRTEKREESFGVAGFMGDADHLTSGDPFARLSPTK